MEEESYGSSERSSTSSEESAPYSPHHSTDNSSNATNPMNVEEEEEESSDDHRISTLPDSILLNILSSLRTKDAVRIRVLSKRWAYLWTSVPTLRFTHTYTGNSFDFASAVDDTLLLHRVPKPTKFSVLFVYNSEERRPRVDRWVRFATTAKVDRLSLRLSFRGCIPPLSYKLSQHLYANEFVSELDFRYCKIKPNGLVRWSSLKRLCIGYTALREDVLNKVLLGSPRLEFFRLHQCCKFNRLDIVSESLKERVFENYREIL